MNQSSHHLTNIPTRKSFSFDNWLNIIMAIATVIFGSISLYFSIYPPNSPKLEKSLLDSILLNGLVIITCLLSAYLFIFTLYFMVFIRRKESRYAQTMYHIHYVNHIVRNYIQEKKRNLHNTDRLSSRLDDITDVISGAFSIITSRNCRASIKQLVNDGGRISVKTISRDKLSRSIPGNIKILDKERLSLIEDNSDFSDVWYGTNGCTRWFLCNDLINLFMQHKYKNSSFKELYKREPTIKIRKFLPPDVDWPLNYKSSIIWPIRFVPDDTQWPREKKEFDNEKKPDFIVWGFLCVDCNSRNVFDVGYATELGAAMADALFILFSELSEIQNAQLEVTPT